MSEYSDATRYKYFLSRTVVDNNGCMIWQGACTWGGYGQARLDGRLVRVHRFIALYNAGLSPRTRAVIMHLCDNSSCINPKHLKVATQSENVKDAYDKGRISYHGQLGVRNGMAKLSDMQVQEIRTKHASGTSQHKLSKEYNISQGHISTIVNGYKRAINVASLIKVELSS